MNLSLENVALVCRKRSLALSLYGLAIVIGLGLLWANDTYQDYGLAVDEPINIEYGEFISSSFTALKTLDFSAENNTFSSNTENTWSARAKNHYPGFYNFIWVTLAELLPGELKYDRLHFAGLLFGVIAGSLSVFWLGYLCGGPALALLSLIILAGLPRFIAEFPINPKDPPFAIFFTFSIASLLFLTRKADSWLRLAVFVLLASCCITVRINGVVLLLFLFIAYNPQFVSSPPARFYQRKVILFSALFLVSGLQILLFWPWLRVDPFLNVFSAMSAALNYPNYASVVLFDGVRYISGEVPRSHFLFWLAASFSLVNLLFFGYSIIHLWLKTKNNTDNLSLNTTFLKLLFVFILLVFLYVLIRNPVRYNAFRHTLFLMPSMAVIAAAGIIYFLNEFPIRAVKLLTLVVLSLNIGRAYFDMSSLHPYGYVAADRLVTGPFSAACKRYENEYWKSGLIEAYRKLEVQLLKTGNFQPQLYLSAFNFYGTINAASPLEPYYSDEISPDWTLDPQQAEYLILHSIDGHCESLGEDDISVSRNACIFACVKSGLSRRQKKQTLKPLQEPRETGKVF